MVVWLYRFIFGRLSIKFYGDFPEKALNLCAENGITLWNSKFKEGSIIANITVKDFYILRYIFKGMGIRIHILHKSGLPFIINRYKKRPGLLIGAIIFIVILQILSSFVWVIDIEGNSITKTQDILNACEKIGIRTGMKVNDVHSKVQREKLLLELDSLSWAALNVEGSRLTINVTETKKEKNEDKKPCNLKAKSDGIIKKIDVTSGNSVVSVGDVVKKGDILVSGIIENVGGTRFVYSKGTVIAEVEKTFTLEEKYKKTVYTENGKSKTKEVLEVFGLKIPLFLGSETHTYKEVSDIKNYEFFGKTLPIKLYKKQFIYTEKTEITRDKEELVEILTEEMNNVIKKEKGENLKITDKDFTYQPDGVILKFKLKSYENIAYCDYLLINAGN